jgi:FtsH-binding integral membrane protein
MYPDGGAQARRYELEYGTNDRAVFDFFNSVYAWMCVGLAVTGTVAWFVSQNVQLVYAMANSGVALAFLLGSVVAVWGIRYAAPRVNPNVGIALFLAYAAVVGVVLSGIFVVYELGTITQVFVITAGTFGAVSVYGFVTKRDLTTIGSICMMGVIGLLLATIVNIFWANSTLYWIISYAGVALFIGLTAYDTQKLKEMAGQLADNPSMAARMAVIGSLELYLDFINLFIFLLRIFGNRR